VAVGLHSRRAAGQPNCRIITPVPFAKTSVRGRARSCRWLSDCGEAGIVGCAGGGGVWVLTTTATAAQTCQARIRVMASELKQPTFHGFPVSSQQDLTRAQRRNGHRPLVTDRRHARATTSRGRTYGGLGSARSADGVPLSGCRLDVALNSTRPRKANNTSVHRVV